MNFNFSPELFTCLISTTNTDKSNLKWRGIYFGSGFQGLIHGHIAPCAPVEEGTAEEYGGKEPHPGTKQRKWQEWNKIFPRPCPWRPISSN